MERNHVVTIAGPGWFNGHPVILHMVNQMTRMTCTPTLLEMRVGRILAVSCCNVLIYCVTVVDWIPAPPSKNNKPSTTWTGSSKDCWPSYIDANQWLFRSLSGDWISPDSPLLCKKRFQGFIHTSPDITEVNNQTCTVCFNYEGEFFSHRYRM